MFRLKNNNLLCTAMKADYLHGCHVACAILATVLLLFSSCKPQEEERQTDNFDRAEMLQFWADSYILPAYEDYGDRLNSLVQAKDSFLITTAQAELTALRDAWLNAYKGWQHVALFEIGPAEEMGYSYFVNTYPTDTAKIRQLAQTGSYNLELPSNNDVQGFPALDYLLYGLADTDAQQLDMLGNQSYKAYLEDVIERLNSLNTVVLNGWKNGYKSQFIKADGSSATASTDKMVNDFIYYYEKHLRAGKIGLPAGVFTGTPLSHLVEAPYSEVYSKALFNEAFTGVQRFFSGKSFDMQTTGTSLEQYLDYVREVNNTPDIAKAIKDDWVSAEKMVEQLSNSFKQQVENDNMKMLETYDALQKVVVLLKVDLLQALNIQVDYVDADGD